MSATVRLFCRSWFRTPSHHFYFTSRRSQHQHQMVPSLARSVAAMSGPPFNGAIQDPTQTASGTCICMGINYWSSSRISRRSFTGLSEARLRKTIFNENKVDKASDEEMLVKGDKMLKLNLNSTRLDGVLKAALQISKNKIEKMFYADRIRVNGDRPKKKSQIMREGDEIDIIQKPNEKNPEFIDVSRIEIVSLGEEMEDDDEDMIEEKGSDDDDFRIPAVLKRYKRLTVENYKQKWKGPVE